MKRELDTSSESSQRSSTRAPYDLFVIGGGSGGVRAARWAAARGLRVGIAEGARYGGTCVNLGCVPKKLFFHAAHFSELLRDSAGFGWSLGGEMDAGTAGSPRHDWALLHHNIEAYITRLNGIYERMLDRTGVERFAGWARFESPHRVRIDYPTPQEVTTINREETEASTTEFEIIEAHHFLVAPGGRPTLPSVEGIELASTSDDFFALTQRPDSALVVGGGYIGVELAGVLSGLGVNTTLATRGDRPLRAFDHDLSSRLDAALRSQMTVRSQSTVQRIELIERASGGEGSARKRVFFSGDPSPIEVDEVIFATGRHPNTARLNLKSAGVELDHLGAVIVDEEYRSSAPHIFAVGDVINKLQLTPVALAEGMRVVSVLCNEPWEPLDYELVPTAIFSHPNVSTVGLSETTARDRGRRVMVYEADFKPMHQAFSTEPRRVYMKIVVDADSDVILGCHMIGDEAGEQIQGLAVAMQAGITKAQLDRTIGIHPTMAEEWVTMRTPRAD